MKVQYSLWDAEVEKKSTLDLYFSTAWVCSLSFHHCQDEGGCITFNKWKKKQKQRKSGIREKRKKKSASAKKQCDCPKSILDEFLYYTADTKNKDFLCWWEQESVAVQISVSSVLINQMSFLLEPVNTVLITPHWYTLLSGGLPTGPWGRQWSACMSTSGPLRTMWNSVILQVFNWPYIVPRVR